jgi:2-oxo-4-hydroxy-4-carboxy-5-ureidoimidazoline decarboxylase
LNDSLTSDARTDLEACCGSTAWVDRMLAARPFANDDAVVESALAIWRSLSREDWLEAFARHPRIGARATSDWSAREQSGMIRATESVRARIDALNRDYEARFGHVFLICATGKGPEEMLAALEERLGNDPDTELRIAVEEQAKILTRRLAKLERP